jgi:uncharacterized oligopeptide transporter (OPT) family protein
MLGPMHRAPSPRAGLALGLGITAVLCCTLTVAGLKAGITPGISPLVILIAWGAFARRLRGPTGIRLLNSAQVTGSAGVAIATGVLFTAPLEPILRARRLDPGLDELSAAHNALLAAGPGQREAAAATLASLRAQLLAELPPLDVWTLIWMSLAGASIGFGFVGLATGRFLSDPSLPAPEAQACKTLVQAAASHPEQRPRLFGSLFLGVLLGLLAGLLPKLGLARSALILAGPFTNPGASRRFVADLHLSPIYLGIGALLTLPTALLVFSGSLLHALLGALTASLPEQSPWAPDWPAAAPRWVGGAAMTVAVAFSLVRFSRPTRTSHSATGQDQSLLWIPPGWRRGLMLAILLGCAGLVGWLLRNDGATPFALAGSAALLLAAAVMVSLGALLSLQIGSSASPVSGTVFVTTLGLAGVALWLGRTAPSDVALLTPLLVAACVAICAANDSSQDYRTLQLCGQPVREGLLPQALGLALGCFLVPPTLALAHQAYVLGSPSLPAPQGTLFAALIDALLLSGRLPLLPVLVGLAIGSIAVGFEWLAHRRGLLLPSMALAVGLYLPPYLGFGMLLGALCRRLAERGDPRRSEGILAAAGLITGGALLDLLLGLLSLALPGFDPQASLLVFDLGSRAERTIASLGLAALGLLLFLNCRRARGAAPGPS